MTRAITGLLTVAFALCCYSVNAVAGPFEDCILQNMKGVQERVAAQAVYTACKEKTTPKKCRDAALQKPIPMDVTDIKTGKVSNIMVEPLEISGEMRKQCLAECASASIWSRTFGECSTD